MVLARHQARPQKGIHSTGHATAKRCPWPSELPDKILRTTITTFRDLTKPDVVYSWGPKHDCAFNEVKNEVPSLGFNL